MVWDLGFRASLFGLEVSPLGSHVLLFYVLSVGFPLGFEVSPFTRQGSMYDIDMLWPECTPYIGAVGPK